MRPIKFIKDWIVSLDWVLLGSIFPIMFFGLITMNSFSDNNLFFTRQLLWIGISFFIFFICTLIDFKFLRRTSVVVWIYVISVAFLVVLFFSGSIFGGAQRWISIGGFNFQPSELAKLALIITLAKYFSRRHVEIRYYKHLIVSGMYAFILFILILKQPDFGLSLVILAIWLGMTLVSGLSKKHLFIVGLIGMASFLLLWNFVLRDYQKARIMTFIHPLEDIQGAGYNAYQSLVAVGSGRMWGKGVGYGTQSRLSFLPEYQTDFIFAAFAEEWGFVGVLLLFACYFVLIFRIIRIALEGETNFEVLFGFGVAILFMSHFVVHVGMNIGLMPITGLTLPFMSYGGTNLLLSFAMVGILMSMKRCTRYIHRDVAKNEFIGI